MLAFSIVLTVLSVILRLVVHVPNFSPVLGFALYAGLQFKSWTGRLLVPLFALFLGDLILSDGDLSFVFHGTFMYVWGSVLLVSLLGVYSESALKMPFWLKGAMSSFVAAVLFFLITNFAVWHLSHDYPPTFRGLIQCYALGLPFFNNTLTSTGLFLFTFEGLRKLHAWYLAAQDERYSFAKAKK